MRDEEVRYTVSFTRSTVPDVAGLTFDEAEQRLADRLTEDGSVEALNDLIWLYRRTGREDRARACLEALLEGQGDLELRALLHVYWGQSYERTGEYDAAIRQYRAAMALEPAAPFASYFLHNNLAYCLNLKGEHEEAARLCRTAIRIDPSRPNGYKNLGISLRGLGDEIGAARAWVAATRANAADYRALGLLEDLVNEQPMLLEREPELAEQLVECRQAVAFAKNLMR